MTKVAQLSETDYVRLLLDHADRLRKLGSEPLAVACATNKFNDGDDDDYWSAVQIGHGYWEQSLFFENESRNHSTAKHSDDAEPAFALGREIIVSLEKEEWRRAGEDILARVPGYYPGGLGYIYALIIQYDQVWLWVGAPNDPETFLYACHSSELVLTAIDKERLDQFIGAPNLLFPESFRQGSLPFLSPTAQAHFRPRITEQAASQELGRLVDDVVTQLRRVTATPVAFWLAPCDPDFVIKADNTVAVSKIINDLDPSKLRQLFERATGLDTQENNARGRAVGGAGGIVFTVIGMAVTVVFEIFVFSLDRTKGLTFEGYSHRRIPNGQIEGHQYLALADPGFFEPVASS